MEKGVGGSSLKKKKKKTTRLSFMGYIEMKGDYRGLQSSDLWSFRFIEGSQDQLIILILLIKFQMGISEEEPIFPCTSKQVHTNQS